MTCNPPRPRPQPLPVSLDTPSVVFTDIEFAPGIAVTVVSDFSVARGVLDSSESYPCDPSSWLRAAGPDVASQPMLQWSPDVLCVSGDAHRRLRRAVTDSLARVDLLRLQKAVEVGDGVAGR